MLHFLDYVDEKELILQRVDRLCTNQKITFPMFKTHKIFFSHFQSWKFFSGNDLSSKMSLWPKKSLGDLIDMMSPSKSYLQCFFDFVIFRRVFRFFLHTFGVLCHLFTAMWGLLTSLTTNPKLLCQTNPKATSSMASSPYYIKLFFNFFQ